MALSKRQKPIANVAEDVCIAVVIPCYKVKGHIEEVITQIGPEVQLIYIVDDACPEGSGEFVKSRVSDPRVHVLFSLENQGVGGAVMKGYNAAIDDGADGVEQILQDSETSELPKYFYKEVYCYNCISSVGNDGFDVSHLRLCFRFPPSGRLEFRSLYNRF